MSHSPLYVIPWQCHFLPTMLEYIQHEHDLSSTLILLPHQRAAQYITHYLATATHIKKPLLLPAVTTGSSFIEEWGRLQEDLPRTTVKMLDRIGLIYACAQQEHQKNSPLFQLEADLFFPWGVRLEAFFEECLTHNCLPQNIHHLEGEIPPFAALLLSRLGHIFQRYLGALDERMWVTPGYRAFNLCQSLSKGPLARPSRWAGKHIYLAGFAQTTGVENIVFHALWQEHKAKVLVHADPLLDTTLCKIDEKPHWSCSIFSNWAQKWHTHLRLVPEHFFRSGTLFSRESQHPKDSPPKEAALGLAQTHSPSAARKKLLLATENTLFSLLPKEPSSAPTESPLTACLNHTPKIRFIEGYDLHSQLLVLQEQLNQHKVPYSSQQDIQQDVQQSPQQGAQHSSQPFSPENGLPISEHDETQGEDNGAIPLAIILPQSHLLMPCLHHLPRIQCNISMGYPLHHAPLFQLIDTLFTLQENRKGADYYWQDLVHLARHPYLKMLNVPAATQVEPQKNEASQSEQEENLIRSELQRFERSIRNEQALYVNPNQLMRTVYNELPAEKRPLPESIQFLEHIFALCLHNLHGAQTLQDISRTLQQLCTVLLTQGADLWKRFPIDAECLHRLIQSLIPELAQNALGQEIFSHKTLFSLTRQLLRHERVPFTASPLVGLQVLGMLESRLLTVNHLHILDTTDTNLPGISEGDPLVSEPLRNEIGLPSTANRSTVAAYHFFRLLAGAKTVSLFWQEGTNPGLEQKQQKSRFVEECLWLAEKKQGCLAEAPTSRLDYHRLNTTLHPRGQCFQPVVVTPAIRVLMEQRLSTGISASFLDSYLLCPVQFFYKYLTRLEEPDGVDTTEDAAAIGTLLHKTLEEFYTSHLGHPLQMTFDEKVKHQKYPAESAQLYEIFLECLGASKKHHSIPADARFMLKHAAKKRLQEYAAHQPTTTPLGLETFISVPFSCNGLSGTCHGSLKGNLDRIDVRDGNLVILDYKTGRLPNNWDHLLEAPDFWKNIENWSPATPAETTQNLIQHICQGKNKPSVQLPFYLNLLAQHKKNNARANPHKEQKNTLWAAIGQHTLTNAAFIDLAKTGKEHPLLPDYLEEEPRILLIQHHFQHLISFLIQHLLHAQTLCPKKGKHCDWCFCKNSCMVSAEK